MMHSLNWISSNSPADEECIYVQFMLNRKSNPGDLYLQGYSIFGQPKKCAISTPAFAYVVYKVELEINVV